MLSESGFRLPVKSNGGDLLLLAQGTVRLQIDFRGTRPEDCALHTAYMGELEPW